MGSIDEVAASNGLERFDLSACEKRLTKGFDLLVRGWIGDGSNSSAAKSVTAFVDDVAIRIRDRNSRGDVASVTGRPALEFSGFRVVVGTSTLSLGTHTLRIVAEQADGRASELEPLHFEVAASESDVASEDVFDISIVSFHGDNVAPCIAERIEKGYAAVISGALHDRRNGSPAASVYAIVDHFDGVRGQTGFDVPGDLGADPRGFALYFTTRELDLGEHLVHLVATATDGTRQSLGPYRFHVVPVCCNLAHPVASGHVARAELLWAGGGRGDASSPRCISADGSAHVRGWAIDPLTGGSVGMAFVAFEDGRQFWISARQYRPELAPVEAPHDAAYCGLVGSFAAEYFSPGPHVGRLHVRGKDGNFFFRTDATVAFEVLVEPGAQ